ncbi:hypothetical protein QUF74_03625 [Candidatus Halobeggiatoa sp. HSG11]|nr:hypothetical protein [Candidatus Halobeggiatoa sp. HSG11]
MNFIKLSFVFAFVFFSALIFAAGDCQICFDKGYDAGQKDKCGICTEPKKCNICPIPKSCEEGDYERGKIDGKKECDICDIPKKCEEGDYERGFSNGQNTCPQITQAGIDEGKKQCREYPTTKGCEGLLKSDTTITTLEGETIMVTQAGVDEGKKQCREDPTIEGCKGLLKSDKTITTPEGETIMVTLTGINEGKRQCKENPVDCKIFQQPVPDNIKTSINNYCAKSADFCGITATQSIKLAKLVNTRCNEGNNCGITIVTSAGIEKGKEEGKKECNSDPSKCFIPIAKIEDSIPDEYCDNKTKNCVSLPHGKLYLPSIEAVANIKNIENTLLFKELEMDAYFGDGGKKVIFVYNSEGNPVETKKLNVTVSGQGEVISYPNGISCYNGTSDDTTNETFNDCDEKYKVETHVDLFAVPKNAKSIFEGWSEGCTGDDNHIIVTMDSDKLNCTATFTATKSEYTLTVKVKDNKGGKVTTDPKGTDCGAGCSKHTKNTPVKLEAEPNDGYDFEKWEGCDEKNNVIKMNENKDDCTAIFTKSATEEITYDLKVQFIGTGDGEVKIGVHNDTCKSSDTVSETYCIKKYNLEETVTLLAIVPSSSNSKFVEWTGCNESIINNNFTDKEINIKMNGNETCVAKITTNK